MRWMGRLRPENIRFFQVIKFRTPQGILISQQHGPAADVTLKFLRSTSDVVDTGVAPVVGLGELGGVDGWCEHVECPAGLEMH